MQHESGDENLPDGTVVGRTDTDELALVISGPELADIEPRLAAALAAAPTSLDLPGGAAVGIAAEMKGQGNETPRRPLIR